MTNSKKSRGYVIPGSIYTHTIHFMRTQIHGSIIHLTLVPEAIKLALIERVLTAAATALMS